MKELSIEAKAKAYDELFVKAKQIYNKENDVLILHTIEELFPELKDEDERIRKALIEYFNEQCDMSDWNGVYGYQVVAWLEKQGEQKPVEPKFKPGDWVVSEVTGSIYQIKNCIENLSNHKYGYDLINGGYISSDEVNHYHLWTIQDAKDGDALYSPCCKLLWIYKDEKTCHVGSNLNYNSGSIVVNKPICIPTDVHPATKEQRDRLEEAIADAGYTFDFEKKELKKIEQDTAWSEEDERNIQDIDSVLFYDKGLPEDTCMRLRNWLKSLRPQNRWKPSDEQMLAVNTAIKVLGKGTLNGKQLIELQEQLKRLKRE